MEEVQNRQHFKLVTGDSVENWSVETDDKEARLSMWLGETTTNEILRIEEPLHVAVYYQGDGLVPITTLLTGCVQRIISKLDWKLDAVFLDRKGVDVAYHEMIGQAQENLFDILIIEPLDWFVTTDAQRHIETVRSMTKKNPALLVSFPWIGIDTGNDNWLSILCTLAYYEEGKQHQRAGDSTPGV